VSRPPRSRRVFGAFRGAPGRPCETIGVATLQRVLEQGAARTAHGRMFFLAVVRKTKIKRIDRAKNQLVSCV
jgi:hypothetical protein